MKIRNLRIISQRILMSQTKRVIKKSNWSTKLHKLRKNLRRKRKNQRNQRRKLKKKKKNLIMNQKKMKIKLSLMKKKKSPMRLKKMKIMMKKSLKEESMNLSSSSKENLDKLRSNIKEVLKVLTRKSIDLTKEDRFIRTWMKKVRIAEILKEDKGVEITNIESLTAIVCQNTIMKITL